jgi:hypothetical protein
MSGLESTGRPGQMLASLKETPDEQLSANDHATDHGTTVLVMPHGHDDDVSKPFERIRSSS